MHKEEVLFQPWAVWYCHNHLDKMVGNAKAITVTKDFAGHTSLASRASTTENAKHVWTALGEYDQQSVLLSSRSQRNSHGPRGLDKALRSIADRSNTSRGY